MSKKRAPELIPMSRLSMFDWEPDMAQLKTTLLGKTQASPGDAIRLGGRNDGRDKDSR